MVLQNEHVVPWAISHHIIFLDRFTNVWIYGKYPVYQCESYARTGVKKHKF